MALKINDIPPEGLTLELQERLDLFNTGTRNTDCSALFTIKPASGGLLQITGRIRSTPELECSRCLARFPFPVDSEVAIDLAPVRSLGPEAEHELTGGELDTEFYEGDEIDPAEIVKEQLLISLPMVPLHSAGCKGLCPVCGADLNTTACGHAQNAPDGFGAFSALKDLLNK